MCKEAQAKEDAEGVCVDTSGPDGGAKAIVFVKAGICVGADGFGGADDDDAPLSRVNFICFMRSCRQYSDVLLLQDM